MILDVTLKNLHKNHRVTRRPPLTVAIAGFGMIGQTIATKLRDNVVPGAVLTAIAAREKAKAQGQLADLEIDVPVLPLCDLPSEAGVVIECAPASIISEVVRPVLSAGKKVERLR